mgnify:CR=1 FL=1
MARNMSDIIELYLKEFLKNQEELEIRRSDIAEHFDCVPSQINYVINTRFTQEHGYLVESKRGGGGYIRILKIQLTDHVDHLDHLMQMIGSRISQRKSENLIETLVNQEIMTPREGRMTLRVLDKTILGQTGLDEQAVRAYLLKEILTELKYSYQ